MAAPTLFDVPSREQRGAVLSPDGLYRYALSRAWDTGQLVTWVLLNPSTADADVDDPTVRRLIGYSCMWRFGRLAVVNLFAWRATDPGELAAAADPVGPGNEASIGEWVRAAHLVVVGWGAHAAKKALRPYGMVERVREIAAGAGKALLCLGTNADGTPKHPLYQPAAANLVPWP